MKTANRPPPTISFDKLQRLDVFRIKCWINADADRKLSLWRLSSSFYTSLLLLLLFVDVSLSLSRMRLINWLLLTDRPHVSTHRPCRASFAAGGFVLCFAFLSWMERCYIPRERENPITRRLLYASCLMGFNSTTIVYIYTIVSAKPRKLLIVLRLYCCIQYRHVYNKRHTISLLCIKVLHIRI